MGCWLLSGGEGVDLLSDECLAITAKLTTAMTVRHETIEEKAFIIVVAEGVKLTTAMTVGHHNGQKRLKKGSNRKGDGQRGYDDSCTSCGGCDPDVLVVVMCLIQRLHWCAGSTSLLYPPWHANTTRNARGRKDSSPGTSDHTPLRKGEISYSTPLRLGAAKAIDYCLWVARSGSAPCFPTYIGFTISFSYVLVDCADAVTSLPLTLAMEKVLQVSDATWKLKPDKTPPSEDGKVYLHLSLKGGTQAPDTPIDGDYDCSECARSSLVAYVESRRRSAISFSFFPLTPALLSTPCGCVCPQGTGRACR